MAESPQPVKVVFVCWGNICRSPMAERIAVEWARREGVDGVEFSSAATSTEELGNPIDPRAARELTDHGYDAADHSAHQIDAAEIEDADLVVAMEDIHIAKMRRMSDRDDVALLSDFDPDAEPGEGVPDPWYDGPEGFTTTREMIERAMPGVLDRVRELQGATRRT